MPNMQIPRVIVMVVVLTTVITGDENDVITTKQFQVQQLIICISVAVNV